MALVTNVPAVIERINYTHTCEAAVWGEFRHGDCTQPAEWCVTLTAHKPLMVLGRMYLCGQHARDAYGTEHEDEVA